MVTRGKDRGVRATNSTPRDHNKLCGVGGGKWHNNLRYDELFLGVCLISSKTITRANPEIFTINKSQYLRDNFEALSFKLKFIGIFDLGITAFRIN